MKMSTNLKEKKNQFVNSSFGSEIEVLERKERILQDELKLVRDKKAKIKEKEKAL